jgi:hypothetical protein
MMPEYVFGCRRDVSAASPARRDLVPVRSLGFYSCSRLHLATAVHVGVADFMTTPSLDAPRCLSALWIG